MARDDKGPVEHFAGIDPTGSLPRLLGAARRIPGVKLWEQSVATTERMILRRLSERIDAVAPEPEPEPRPFSAGAPPTESPHAILSELLSSSLEQSPQQSRQQLFIGILQRIVPDEARMLSALSDGSAYVLIHIAAPALPGTPSRKLFENASNIGRAAGITLTERTPGYVSHLLALGLITVGPEDPALTTEYDILLTNTELKQALAAANKLSRLPPRVIKRTIRLSAFGRELWDAASASY